MKDHNIWIIPKNSELDAFQQVESFMIFFRKYLKKCTNKNLVIAPMSVFLPTVIDDMKMRVVKYIEEKGWETSSDYNKLQMASVVITIENMESFKKDESNYLQAATDGKNWSLLPKKKLDEVIPSQWYDLQILKDAFPNEHFVKLNETLESPYLWAAKCIKDSAFFTIKYGSSEKHIRSHQNNSDLVNYLEKIHHSLLHYGPSKEPLYYIRQFQNTIERRHGVFGHNKEDYRFKHFVISKEFEKGIPFPADMDSVDTLLYLIITGAIEGQLPLSVANSVCDDEFFWDSPLGSLKTLALNFKIPKIPLQGIKLNNIGINSKKNLIYDSKKDIEPFVLGKNWCERRIVKRAIKGAVTYFFRETIGVDWAKLERQDNHLMQIDNTILNLSTKLPYKFVDPSNIIEINNLLPDIKTCLELWRSIPTTSEEYDKRQLIWKKHKDGDNVVPRIAEGIFNEYAPWPDPLVLRSDNNKVWQWTPQQCVQEIKPWFKIFSESPIREEPKNLVATFLYLIATSNMICHAWPELFENTWNFKLKTHDHSWILGQIWMNPESKETQTQRSPLKIESHLGVLVMSTRNLNCAIKETH